MSTDPFSNEPIVDDTPAEVTADDLVGEGRKYKTLDELAKAYNNADAFIEKQKADKAQLEAELKVLRDLAEARAAKPDDTPKVPSTPDSQRQADPAAAPKVDVDIGKLIRDELASANESTRKANNINSAAEALNRVYGSPAKAQEAIKQKATELNVSFDWLRNLAADSPEAMLRAMNVDPQARATSSVGYSPDVDVGRQQTNVRNFKHYEAIRKADVKRYNSAEMRKQMFDDAQKLGDKFYL